ncbi:hypothetical protein [Numidum massiliense]|uniref:hypothetical protein n=1 Tax=Numidum massiliense TaxID=1522315 RepID=UPI0006D5361A|nr:hypothetical protein [Numidum massiliense]
MSKVRYMPLYKEIASYINRVVGRRVVTPMLFHEWVEEAKVIKRRRGTLALVSHYRRLYKQYVTEEEEEVLKRSRRKNELSFKMIDVLIAEGVLSLTQANLLKQYVRRT